ncbi:TIGR03089 family protein [Galactobacter valiniphilus]|uniref:TIGR03089 family protein n=1 Tax=Galactobacter valiniphilus TaxID=2676122 RepID=UPI00373653A6
MPTMSRADGAGAALLRWAAQRAASTSPALVDLSLEPARIELSGRVLVNWWAKNAGLLDAEWGIGPGSRVAVQAPAHWRVLPLVLAALSLGAQVGPADLEDADLLITTDPASPEAAAHPEVLAVTTAALAVSFGAPLPAGVVDHAAEVRAYPDRLLAQPGQADAAAWEHDGEELTLGELLAGGEDGEGAALEVPAQAGLLAALTALLRSGAAGSVVLAPEGGLSERLRAQERVTRSLA